MREIRKSGSMRECRKRAATYRACVLLYRVPDRDARARHNFHHTTTHPVCDEKCYLCLRNNLLPMCPEWTRNILVDGMGFE